MPGNEVGDKVHNLFGQDNLSQGRHHPQVIKGNWPHLSNNPWVENQRQIGSPYNSNFKNYNVQQSDVESGDGSQSYYTPHGLAQSSQTPEFSRLQSQNQQVTNGFVRGHQVFQTGQNETNLLGVDTKSNMHNLTSRGLSGIESHKGNGSDQNKIFTRRVETSKSPVSYDFFGGQQHISSQQIGMLRSLPRQQPGIGDMHLLQQHVILAQMQEFNRQQQFQQLDARQQSYMNQVSSTEKQGASNHSPSLINGVPINEALNHSYCSELMAGDANWVQPAASSAMQGSSGGHMSAEQSQALQIMGLVPQQTEQSPYGVPLSSHSGTHGPYPNMQMDKMPMQRMPPNSSSSMGNAYAALSDQVSLQGGSKVSKLDSQRKNMFESGSGQSMSTGPDFKNLYQSNHLQRSAPLKEFQRIQEVAGSSESSQGKVLKVASSLSVATLDPAEEKILFGFDDSIQYAFSRSTNVAREGCNMPDGTEYFSGYPSVQSGTWSALMQSAVAETSSADVGKEEYLSGHHFQSPEPFTMNQQPPTVNDGSKQVLWADNNMQHASAFNTRQYTLSDDANKPSLTMNSNSVPELQQPGFKISLEPSDMLQSDSSQKFIPPFPEHGKCSDHEPLERMSAENSHVFENFGLSSVKTIANNHSGSWSCQQSINSYNNDGHHYNRSSGWNFMGSMSAANSNTFKGHENKSVSIPSQTGDGKISMHDKLDPLSGMWRTDSTLTANAGFEDVRSSVGSPLLGRESSNMSNVAAPNPCTGRSNQESKQFSKSHKLDLWKSVDPSVKSGGEVNQNQPNFDTSHQSFESSLDTGFGKGAVEVHQQLENSDSKENSSESIGHHHHSTGAVRENIWSDADDSCSYLARNQKSSRSAGRRPPETSLRAKHATHSQTMAQQCSRGLKCHEQINYGQSAFVGLTDRMSIEMGQGQAAGSQGGIKGSEGTLSKSMFPNFMPNTSDRSIGNFTPNKAMPLSQNMLELLHKVDHSSEHSTATPLSSSDRNTSSDKHEPEASDGSVGHIRQNHSSDSRSFGLQLGPPSQRPPMTDYVFSSQHSMPRVFIASNVSPEIGEKGNSKLDSMALDETLPSGKPSEEIRNSGTSGHIESETSQFNVQGSSSLSILSGFPFSKNFGNLHVIAASRQVAAHQSITMPSESVSSRSKLIDDTYERAQVNQFVPTSVASLSGSTTQNIVYSSAEVSELNISNQDGSRELSRWTLEQGDAPATLPSFAPGSSQLGGVSKVLSNAWNSVPCQQPLLGTQPSNTASSLFRSNLQSDNNLLTTLPGLPRVNGQDTLEGKSGLSLFCAIPANLQCLRLQQPAKETHGQQVSLESLHPVEKTSSVSQGREYVVNHFSEGSTSKTCTTTQRDIEVFGRSLRSNNSLHQNYSLLHQVRAMTNMEGEAGDRSANGLKVPEFVVQHPQVGSKGEKIPRHGYNSTVRDSSANQLAAPSEDSEVISFSPTPVEGRDSNAFSQNGPFSQNNSHNLPGSSNMLSIRQEHSLISPPMAPSWFDQYGTFKNGQVLAAYDMKNQIPSTLNSMEQPFEVGRLADDQNARCLVEQGDVTYSCKPDVQQGSTPTYAAKVHANSLHLMPPDITDQSLVVRPKKRKTATYELLPWHKELTEASRSLQTISIAESDWARATNRLLEKLEDDAEMSEDAPSMLRSKRRLILTMQLVEQLLFLPPVTYLCKDASSECESVAYFTARQALGDACSAITCFGSVLPRDRERLLSEKSKVPERVSQQCSKVVEDFIGRIRKLESNFSRLDKRASILELRVDCQDLDKFSVINRFAKFHGRGQSDGADTLSLSDTTPYVQKACPQKYVIAFPMPRNLPDRVHCLAL